MIKVYIIDDHPLMIMGIKNLIQSGNDEFRVVGSAGNIQCVLSHWQIEFWKLEYG